MGSIRDDEHSRQAASLGEAVSIVSPARASLFGASTPTAYDDEINRGAM